MALSATLRSESPFKAWLAQKKKKRERDDVKEVWIDCELCVENKGKVEQGSKGPNF